ncbi:MAG: DUF72 domain-containing protein [Ignavibacteria bacterium]|nr:DUF72 domain-containing protein [Ignavibacteria bacterium]
MKKLKIGTCSWKYDSWKGIIYPNDAKFNYLEEYSKYFNTVEIDQWFWSLFDKDKIRLPNPKDVNEYYKSVPDSFQFTIKLPNSITLTHYYKKSKSAPLIPNDNFLSKKLFDTILKKLEPMKEKIGILMFQFEYLNKQKMSSQIEFQDKFSSFISKCSDEFNYGIEIRNPNYLNQTYFDFLKDDGLAHVFLQGYYMPDIFELFQKFEKSIKKQTVIRLHGPDRKGIEERSGSDWSKRIEPNESELEKVVEMIQTLQKKKVDLFVNVNNHFEGSAPLTIKRIEELMGV